MRPDQRREFRERLRRDLECVVEGEVQNLHWNRDIFRQFMVTLSHCDRRLRSNPFIDLVIVSYAASACIAIRRVLDIGRNKDIASLGSIVQRLCRHPELWTRSDYVRTRTQYVGPPRGPSATPSKAVEDIADREFDRFACLGADILCSTKLNDRFIQAKGKCDVIIDNVDKLWAHSSRKMPRRPAIWRDLYDAVDAVECLFQDVSLLVRGCYPTPNAPGKLERGWESIFSASWLKR